MPYFIRFYPFCTEVLFMNKQDNRLAFSVVATLLSGIALIYTFIMFPKIIFAIAGISLVFIIAAFILTQNILAYASEKEKSINSQIRDSVDHISTQIETMNTVNSQLDKATFLYTKQVAKTLSTLENNYVESQEALYKNLSELSNTQNKSTKLMIKYNQSTATKMISTLKDLRNQLSETMIQGFDQIQPNNAEIIETLEDIVDYLKTQSTGMEQSMGLQLNNVAHELQNISNSIQRVQVAMPAMPQVTMQQAEPVTASEMPVTASVSEVPENATASKAPITMNTSEETLIQETENAEPAVETAPENKTSLDPSDLEMLFNSIEENDDIAEVSEITPEETVEEIQEEIVAESVEETPAEAVAEPVEETSMETSTIPAVSDDPNKQLSPEEIAALFAAAEPSPKKEPEEAIEEEKPFTPTFTVVGKEEPKEAAPKEPEPIMDDPNKQLSPDEIAALFAAADPAPKKSEKAPEPVKMEPITDDPNKQLSPDEIAALFAAAEPSPKKEAPEEKPEPVKAEAVSDDPNRQLSPEEIAALFASMG